MATQVIMPQLGESVVEGTIGQWLVGAGQPVKQYDPLLQVTTDKVDTEISAPASGILLKIYVPEGQTVDAGTVLALIGAADEVAPDQPPPAAPAGHGGQAEPLASEAGTAGPAGEQSAAATPAADAGAPAATPVAQRMAQEHGVELTAVSGSGPGGRITKEDVEAYLAGGQEQGRAAPAAAPAGPPERRSLGFISPAVARLAAEYHVDLAAIRGTGEAGRITKKDVMASLAGQAAPAPAQAAEPELQPWEQPGTGSLFKPTEEAGPEPAAPSAPARPAAPPPQAVPPRPAAPPVAPGATATDADVLPLSTIRRSIAKHMVASKQTSAHVTTVMEADMTRVVQARERLKSDYERQGVKLTFTPFFLQAIVAGLQAVPQANSSFQEDSLLVHRRIHIGVAVAIPDGLIVPVIRDANEKSLLGLARAVNDLAERARTRRLAPEEVQGGTFTLTNHGTGGSLLATPIINQPQAGILGVGTIQKRPVVISAGASLLPGPDDYLAIRPMVYLSFSFDHRILDGAGADTFLAAVKQYLETYG